MTVSAPEEEIPSTLEQILAQGAQWWPLRMARELDDAILMLRTNDLELGLWIIRTRGSKDHVLSGDRVLYEHRGHWFVRETIGQVRRTLARLETTSRSMFALVHREVMLYAYTRNSAEALGQLADIGTP